VASIAKREINTMRVFVTGATGWVGSAVVADLIGAGHEVLGLCRTPSKAEALKAAGAEVLAGDITDLDCLRRGAAWSEGVIHTAFNHDFSRIIENSAEEQRAIAAMGAVLEGSTRPLIVTSYVGRQPAAVAQLVRLAHRLGIGVYESCPSTMNYPQDDAMYVGGQWNQPVQNPCLAEADAVLVIDSDVPWIPTINKPSAKAVIRHIDVDPMKTDIPLWYLPTVAAYTADSLTALKQLNAALEHLKVDEAKVRARRAHWTKRHADRAQALEAAEAAPKGVITVPYLVACLRRQAKDAIFLSEGITNYAAISDHLNRTEPGTFFTSGAGSLGWSGGAAVGVESTIFTSCSPSTSITRLSQSKLYLPSSGSHRPQQNSPMRATLKPAACINWASCSHWDSGLSAEPP
jgi:hypothetical protein